MEFVFEGRDFDTPHAKSIWRTRSDHAGTFVSQAACQWEMVIWKYEGETQITVRGPETQANRVDSPANAEFFGIQFKMGAFMPHLPLSKMVGMGITLPKSSGNGFWLHGSVWELPNYNNADTFVNRMIREGLIVADPEVEAALEGQTTDLSVRTLQYRFLRATGLTQATIRQIERARQATALLIQGVPILDTVYETGYFDQAHLTRSLRRYMGHTPAQIATSRTE